MNSWPILQRELLTSARDWRTSYGRIYAPAVMLLFLGWLLWMFRGVPSVGMPGDFIFRFNAYIAFGVSIFGGALRTSDSLSREKREETLVLLFLTDLNGLDVVLGKLFGASVKAFYACFATIPVLGVAMLFGGVTLAEVGRIALSLFVALFFSLSIGLLVSSITRAQKRAQGMAAFGILTFVVFIPVAAESIRNNLEWPRLAQYLEILSPLYAQNMSFSTALGLRANYFWLAVGIHFSLALLFLWVASRTIERTWKLRPPGVKALTWKEKWAQWTMGDLATRKAYRTRLLSRNPLFWLVARDRLGPWWSLLILVTCITAGVFCIWYYELDDGQKIGAVIVTFIVLDYYFKMRIAAIASQQLGQDRQSGALELILSTPTSIREILRGHWLALQRNFLWPILLFWALETLTFVSFRLLAPNFPDFVTYLFGTYLLVSFGDAICIAWIAMWKAMRLFNPIYAAGTALIRIALLPWFVFGIVVSSLTQWSLTSNWWKQQEPEVVMLVGLAVWAISVIGSAIKARYGLYKYFRAAATDRFQLKSRFTRFGELLLKIRAAVKPAIPLTIVAVDKRQSH